MFEITKRHYDIIIKQVQQNFPYESGGFVGGKDNVITAILPSFNQDISNKTNVFAITREDIDRAHLFFEKHGLEYYGTYHSHPKGPAIPSEQDLKNIQKQLFIISLMDFDNPDFAAYLVTGVQKAERVPLKVVSNKQYESVDLHSKKKQANGKDTIPKKQLPDYDDTDQLSQQVQDIFDSKSNYKKDSRYDNDGDFTTLA